MSAAADPILLAGVADYLRTSGKPAMAQLVADAVLALKPFEQPDGSALVGDCAVVNGKRYPLTYAGVDRATYRHEPGCLANVPGNCCQCGAIDRATRMYVAEVKPT